LTCQFRESISDDDYPICPPKAVEGWCNLSPPHGVGIYPAVELLQVGGSAIVYCKEGEIQKDLIDCISTESITEEDYPECGQDGVTHAGLSRWRMSRRRKNKAGKARKIANEANKKKKPVWARKLTKEAKKKKANEARAKVGNKKKKKKTYNRSRYRPVAKVAPVELRKLKDLPVLKELTQSRKPQQTEKPAKIEFEEDDEDALIDFSNDFFYEDQTTEEEIDEEEEDMEKEQMEEEQAEKERVEIVKEVKKEIAKEAALMNGTPIELTECEEPIPEKVTKENWVRCPKGVSKVLITDRYWARYTKPWSYLTKSKVEGGWILTITKEMEERLNADWNARCGSSYLFAPMDAEGRESRSECGRVKLEAVKENRYIYTPDKIWHGINPGRKMALYLKDKQLQYMMKDGYFVYHPEKYEDPRRTSILGPAAWTVLRDYRRTIPRGYFRGPLERKMEEGYRVELRDSNGVKDFMRNIKEDCKDFKWADPMFPCDGYCQFLNTDGVGFIIKNSKLTREQAVKLGSKTLPRVITIAMGDEVGTSCESNFSGYHWSTCEFTNSIQEKSLDACGKLIVKEETSAEIAKRVAGYTIKPDMYNNLRQVIKDNGYERNPEGLKLIVTFMQFENMWKDGYFEGDLTTPVGQDAVNKKKMDGGYFIWLTTEKEIKFLENIRRKCRHFKWADFMFPCEGHCQFRKYPLFVTKRDGKYHAPKMGFWFKASTTRLTFAEIDAIYAAGELTWRDDDYETYLEEVYPEDYLSRKEDNRDMSFGTWLTIPVGSAVGTWCKAYVGLIRWNFCRSTDSIRETEVDSCKDMRHCIEGHSGKTAEEFFTLPAPEKAPEAKLVEYETFWGKDEWYQDKWAGVRAKQELPNGGAPLSPSEKSQREKSRKVFEEKKKLMGGINLA